MVSESESEVTQSCPTLCDPMDCSPLGSSVRGVLQARMLEWVAISFSRESSRPRDWTQVSRISGRCFNLWATKEVVVCLPFEKKKSALSFTDLFYFLSWLSFILINVLILISFLRLNFCFIYFSFSSSLRYKVRSVENFPVSWELV